MNIFISLIAQLGVAALLLALLSALKVVAINWRWIVITLMLFVSYFMALTYGQPLTTLLGDFDWNWGGKLAGIALWLIVLILTAYLKPNFSPADAGFTLRQNPDSLRDSLIVTAGLVLFHMALVSYLGGSTPSTEGLLYQELMPGLDEEPHFRGILLYFFSLALISRKFSVWKADLTIAGLLLVLIFALVHALEVTFTSWQFYPLPFFIAGAYGLVFLWLRERTGSLVLPILGHNLVNFSGQWM